MLATIAIDWIIPYFPQSTMKECLSQRLREQRLLLLSWHWNSVASYPVSRLLHSGLMVRLGMLAQAAGVRLSLQEGWLYSSGNSSHTSSGYLLPAAQRAQSYTSGTATSFTYTLRHTVTNTLNDTRDGTITLLTDRS